MKKILIHSILVKFRGKADMDIYDKIRKQAIENNISVNAIVIMICNKHYNKKYLKSGEAENHTE